MDDIGGYILSILSIGLYGQYRDMDISYFLSIGQYG